MIDFQLLNVEDTKWFGNGSMDIDYDNLGNVVLVQGVYFLNQGIQKNIMTVLRDTNLYPQYGSEVDNLKGKKLDDSIVKSYLVRVIIDALDRATVRQNESVLDFTYVDEEIFDSLMNIQLQQDTKQKTKYNVTVSVLTKQGETSFSFLIDKEKT